MPDSVVLSSGLTVRLNGSTGRRPYALANLPNDMVVSHASLSNTLGECLQWADVDLVRSLTAAPSALSSEVADVLDRVNRRLVYLAEHMGAEPDDASMNEIRDDVATLRSALSRSSLKEAAGVLTRKEIVRVIFDEFKNPVPTSAYRAADAVLALLHRSPQHSAPSATEDSTTELTPEIRNAFMAALYTQRVLRKKLTPQQRKKVVAERDTALLALVNACRKGR